MFRSTRFAFADNPGRSHGHKHGKLDEASERFIFETPEAETAFQADGRELLAVEVEISGEPFLIDDFGPRKLTAGDFLSANDIVHLGWLVVEERPEPVSAAAASS